MTDRLSKENASSIIYAGARSPETAKDLQRLAEKSSGRIRIIQLDPTSEDSVTVRARNKNGRALVNFKAAIKLVQEEQGSLDVLINNAGYVTSAGREHC